MDQLHEVEVPVVPLAVLGPLIGPERQAALEAAASKSRDLLAGKVVWNVNSTAAGGGVAELLRVLVGYIQGAGVDSRWLVIHGDPDFFAITKRVHNRIHGVQGDTGALGPAEATRYAEVCAANAAAMQTLIRTGDAVLLHDPQTAGMAPALREAGLKVIWRSHIGSELSDRWTEEAWHFLRPHLEACDAFVFTRLDYVPDWIERERVSIIPPSIDPFSAKNREIPAGNLPRLLARMGLTSGPTDEPAYFTRSDGTLDTLVRAANVVSEGDTPEALDNLVVQVSRWDRLKDPLGVIQGFASSLGPDDEVNARLALVGPPVDGVADDPEADEVFGECLAHWHTLPTAVRRRILLVQLPMVDADENAAMVNALQRAASIIVQKSLVEGFGLTVAEGMWKGKPIVGSRVGGIIDQVVPGTGVLLDDPSDLETFGATLRSMLAEPDELTRLGLNARRHVLQQFVGDRHLLQYAALMERIFSPR